MRPTLTDTLCTRCALCCDGSLFADAELTGRAEGARLEILGLEVEDDDEVVLVQPCAALKGRRCGIYAQRPSCCRTFECQLLLDVRHGAVSVERARRHISEALGLVRRAKSGLVRSGQHDHHLPLAERCEEALAGERRADPRALRRRAELAATMNTLRTLIRKVFLRGERLRTAREGRASGPS